MPWLRHRDPVTNLWGLFLDALVLTFIAGLVVRGCQAIAAAFQSAAADVLTGVRALVPW